MSTSFHDVRLPDEIEQGATGGPSYQTTVITMSSGQEQRNIDWEDARATYDISYGIQEKEDFEVCLAFYYARRGRAYGFLFKDWGDFDLTLELLGLGDATTTDFPIYKVYEPTGPAPYFRPITRPIAESLVVTVDGVETSAYTLLPTGIISFNVAPALHKEVRVSGEFDVPVRFDVDQFPLTLQTATAGTIGQLPLVELRERV